MSPHPRQETIDADSEVLCRIAGARRVLDAIVAGVWAPDIELLGGVAELLAAAEQWVGGRDAA